MADAALAGLVIASHYAEPLPRLVSVTTPLREARGEDSVAIRELRQGEPFAMLDDSLGWAWGYAGNERLVGYVVSEALGTQ